jgi:endonuclease G
MNSTQDGDRSRQLREYATRLLQPKLALELASAESPEEAAETFVSAAIAWADRDSAERPHAAMKDAARRAYVALTSTEEAYTEIDNGALEAIILPGLRPIGDIRDGTFKLPDAGEFVDYTTDSAIRQKLEAAIRGVGCVVLPRHPLLPYGGTGFVVGDGLVMTNRHVAEIFSRGLGTKGLTLLSQYGAAIDPLREQEGRSENIFVVKGVRMVHPYWDMAILEVPGLPMPALSLAPLEIGAGRWRVAVIGYPAFDSRNPAQVQLDVFHGHFNVKRLAPGYLTGVSSVESFKHDVPAGTHDASTLGGNSGSAVIDVTTGNVVALHFAGLYQQTNYAVPVAQLARDRRVIDAGVKFTETHPDPNLPWDRFWRDVVESPPPQEPSASASPSSVSAASAGGTLRVTVPIEISIGVGNAVIAVASPEAATVAPGKVEGLFEKGPPRIQ